MGGVTVLPSPNMPDPQTGVNILGEAALALNKVYEKELNDDKD